MVDQRVTSSRQVELPPHRRVSKTRTLLSLYSASWCLICNHLSNFSSAVGNKIEDNLYPRWPYNIFTTVIFTIGFHRFLSNPLEQFAKPSFFLFQKTMYLSASHSLPKLSKTVKSLRFSPTRKLIYQCCKLNIPLFFSCV